MKLKDRFKKALFAFFKNEILEAVSWKGTVLEKTQIVSAELKFTEIKADIFIQDTTNALVPASVVYERSLREAREKIFEEAMKMVVIDERSVMDTNIYPHRVIRVSLFVGYKTK